MNVNALYQLLMQAQTAAARPVFLASSNAKESVLAVALPGVPADAVSVSVLPNLLGFRVDLAETTVLGHKLAARAFAVPMPDPELHALDATAASVKDGLLTFTVPKRAPRAIPVRLG